MKYEDIVETIKENLPCKIDYKEYSVTVDDVKFPILEIKDVEVINFIEPMEFMKPIDIEKYYGEYEISLTRSNNIRLILKNEEYEYFDKEYIVLDINQLSYENGLQEIEINHNRLNEFEVRRWI
ncbi:hypothetical protein KQI68_06720 [Peptoniphilus sp. MSJ-1]|uniref:Uncharacterized protein n=1 Tax=Peptoniphilus ovalis TaxID=2841503 RepID=A0ABS6FH84_9FIRM|nr:hypothetical protein [Peptoniphilus ovalis]MBU5669531.1 hypothetical protein [Peptoniphilus ovalis]